MDPWIIISILVTLIASYLVYKLYTLRKKGSSMVTGDVECQSCIEAEAEIERLKDLHKLEMEELKRTHLAEMEREKKREERGKAIILGKLAAKVERETGIKIEKPKSKTKAKSKPKREPTQDIIPDGVDIFDLP